MEAGHDLKTLLQIQLASDASAVRHLPFTLTSLTRDSFYPSPHLAKWTIRIQALLHSKDSGTRWAGLCLAYKTSNLSQNFMIETAQSYLGVALPLLSRNEPTPTLKAAIRLLRTIFTTALDITEFQRQVSTPNVLKFTTSIISLAENHGDTDLKVLCVDTLTRLITLYPNAHRASCAALSAFSLRYLNGSAISPTSSKVLDAISRLYSVLHLTGGKVGAVSLWRKSTEETLSFGWEALFSLRTTFPDQGQTIGRRTINEEPQIHIPLNLDRLRCTVTILCNLMSTIVQRPIQVPVGHLVRFCTNLLSCTIHGQAEGFVDPSVRSMEIAIVPAIWSLGCDLLSCLTIRLGHILDAHTSRLISVLNFQLEQNPTSRYRLPFLNALDALLRNCHPLDSPFLPTLLAKAIVPSIAAVLTTTTSGNAPGSTEPSCGKNNKGKKRSRNYEGDEIFNASREVICATDKEGKVLLASIDVIGHLFRNPNLSSAMQSVIARIIISTLIILPRMPPALLSANPGLIYQVKEKIQKLSVSIGSGTSSVMSKSLSFVVEAALEGSNIPAQKEIGVLLHPRLPPLVRSMPHVESLSLFKAEEPQDEVEALSTLGLTYTHTSQPQITQGVSMIDSLTTAPTENYPTEIFRDSALPPVEPKEQIPVILTNPPPPLTKPSNILETAKSTVGLHSTDALSKMASDNTGRLFTAVSNPVPFPREDEQDGDEEMPLIDIDSDSEDEAID